MALEKFHSVLLSSCGVVLTCGHGRGGRLGHGSEASVVVSSVNVNFCLVCSRVAHAHCQHAECATVDSTVSE